MEEIFPETLFVSQEGSGEDTYLGANHSEEAAIKGTDDGSNALVAEYRLVAVRKRKITTLVEDFE